MEVSSCIVYSYRFIEVFPQFQRYPADRAPNSQSLLVGSGLQGLFNFVNYLEDIGVVVEVVMLQVHLYVSVTDHGVGVSVNFHLDVGFDVSETCELLEVPPEGISGMVEGLIASRDKTASLDDIVPFVIGGGCEVFIDRVDLKFLKRVDRSNRVLPHITHDVVEISNFEHIHRVGGHPILHVDVSN